MPDNGDNRLSRLATAAAFVLVVMLLIGGWWLFPRVQAYVAFQDCVATGRTNCRTTPSGAP